MFVAHYLGVAHIFNIGLDWQRLLFLAPLAPPQFFETRLDLSQLECDTVIMAIGQAPKLDFLKPHDGVEISPRGLIAVNPQTLMTSAAGIFAGGDCVFGPRLIIDSVADGKRAAVGIDEYLRGQKHPDPIIEVEDNLRDALSLPPAAR